MAGNFRERRGHVAATLLLTLAFASMPHVSSAERPFHRGPPETQFVLSDQDLIDAALEPRERTGASLLTRRWSRNDVTEETIEVGQFVVSSGRRREVRIVGVSTADGRRLDEQQLREFEEQAREDQRAAFGALRQSSHEEISDLDPDAKVEVGIVIHAGAAANDGSSALVAQELAAELEQLGFDAKAGSSGTGRVWATVPAKTALELAHRDEVRHMEASPADEPLRDAQARRRTSPSGLSYLDVGVSLQGFGARVNEDDPPACAWIIASRAAQVRLFRGRGSFSDLPALRKLDYDKNLVLMILGRAGPHDASITIPELVAQDGHLVISIERHPPPRNRLTNWTTSRPFRVIAIPRMALEGLSVPPNPTIEIKGAGGVKLWEDVARVATAENSVSECRAEQSSARE